MNSHFYVTFLPKIITNQEQNGRAFEIECCRVASSPGNFLVPLYSAYSPGHEATFYSQYVMDFEYCLYVEKAGFLPIGLICYFPPYGTLGTVPLYMVYNEGTQDIFFTKDARLSMESEGDGYSQVAPYGLLHGNLLPNGDPPEPYVYIYPNQIPGTFPLYQLFSVNQHQYTMDDNQRNYLLKLGAVDQGTIGWVNQPSTGLAPLYASMSPAKTFFYTMDLSEHSHALSDLGHKGQGAVCYCYPTTQPQPPDTVPLYRMYRAATDDHFYTADPAVRDNYEALYLYEKVAAYVYPVTSNEGVPLLQFWGPSSTNTATAAGIGPVPGTCGA